MTTKEALAVYRSNFQTLDGITPNPSFKSSGYFYNWRWDATWDGALWETIYSLEVQGIKFKLPGGQWSVVRKGKLRFEAPKDYMEWMLLCSLLNVYDEIQHYSISRKFATIQLDMKKVQSKARKQIYGRG